MASLHAFRCRYTNSLRCPPYVSCHVKQYLQEVMVAMGGSLATAIAAAIPSCPMSQEFSTFSIHLPTSRLGGRASETAAAAAASAYMASPGLRNSIVCMSIKDKNVKCCWVLSLTSAGVVMIDSISAASARLPCSATAIMSYTHCTAAHNSRLGFLQAAGAVWPAKPVLLQQTAAPCLSSMGISDISLFWSECAPCWLLDKQWEVVWRSKTCSRHVPS